MATRVFDLGNYSLSVYALPTILATGAILLLGVLVLVRERLSLVSVSLFLITLIFSFWFFCFSWIYCSLDEQVSLWWGTTAYFGIPFLPSAVYQFAVVVLRIHQSHKKMILLMWSLSAFFSVANAGTGALIAGVHHYSWGYYPKYGWLSVPFLIFFFGLLFASMRHYWIEYRKAEPGIHKQRIKAFRAAWVIAYLAALDILPKYGVALYPFGYLPIVLFVLLSARAIWRYRLVDITPSFGAQQIIDTMSDALLVLDHEGVIRLVNRGARELFNRSEQELLEKPFAMALDGALPPDALQELLRTGKLEYELHYASSGSPRLLSLSASLMRDRDEQPEAIVCIIRDITERIELTRRIEESQEKYQNIVENSLDGIVVVQEGKLVYVNPSAARIFEYDSPDRMKMINFSETVAPASRPFVFAGDEQQTIREDILRNYEMKGLTKQGTIIDLDVNAQLITWNGRPAVQASFRNITERKKIEREHAIWLWEQETMRPIDRHLMSLVDLQGVLDILAHHARQLVGSDVAGVLTTDRERGWARWLSMKGGTGALPTDFTPIGEAAKKFYDENGPVVAEDFGKNEVYTTGDFPVLVKEGVVSAIQFPLRKGAIQFGHLVVGFRKHRVISERMMRLLTSLADRATVAIMNAELYDQLRRHEKELKILSEARVQAQEEERRRIAREIHDGLGQMLTAIKFNVEILEDNVDVSEDERNRIQDIKGLLDNVMTEAREISYNLMPSVLVDFGLASALQLLTEEVSKRNNLTVAFHSLGFTERLDPPLEVGLYRIAQEALNNVVKHAHAKEVAVQIVRDETGIRLTIEDDGEGFELRNLSVTRAEKRGMGLPSMRERVLSFNGTLSIDSTPLHGTEIVVEIPLAPKDSGDSHGWESITS